MPLSGETALCDCHYSFTIYRYTCNNNESIELQTCQWYNYDSLYIWKGGVLYTSVTASTRVCWTFVLRQMRINRIERGATTRDRLGAMYKERRALWQFDGVLLYTIYILRGGAIGTRGGQTVSRLRMFPRYIYVYKCGQSTDTSYIRTTSQRISHVA